MAQKEIKVTERHWQLGGVILAGGQSTRMGQDKAQLLYRGKTFLQHVVDRLLEVTDRIIIAGSPDRRTVAAPPGTVRWVPDQQANVGPLEGIRSGLETLAPERELAFVVSCDTPLIRPAVIQRLLKRLGDHDGVIPVHQGRWLGTTALYRTCVGTRIGPLIAAQKRRVTDLIGAIDAIRIDTQAFSDIDPKGESFLNINNREDYQSLQ